MAKLRGIVSAAISGKSGGVVFAKGMKGDTIMRPYQPTVKNPNTLRQRVSRSKMSMASKAAAALAEVIGIGYAKAAAGSGMYPRNMFVQGVVPVNAGVITLLNNQPKLQLQLLEVSKANGLYIMPQVTVVVDDQNNLLKMTATNTAEVPLNEGEKLGLVLAIVDGDADEGIEKSVVVKGDASTTLQLDLDIASDYSGCNIYGFYKIIPEGVNGVDSALWPWKYPSATGASRIVGTVG